MAVTARHDFDEAIGRTDAQRRAGARQGVAFSLDVRGLAQLNEAFRRMPHAAEKALRRATKALSRWLTRRVLQAAAQASGITQKGLVASKRGIDPAKASVTIGMDGYSIRVWIGTAPIHAQHLGRARWTPYRGRGSRPAGSPKRPGRGAGARVRNHLFTGTWVWGQGSKSGPKVLHRTGRKAAYRDARGYEKEGVTEPLYDIVHSPVQAWLQRLEGDAARRFDALLRQQLNYALNVERR